MRKVSTDTTGYELTVTGAQGISAAPTGDPTVPLPGFLNSAGPAVSVTLPDGGQPTEPVMLRFDFTGRTAPRTSESLVPAVVAVSSGIPSARGVAIEVGSGHQHTDRSNLALE